MGEKVRHPRAVAIAVARELCGLLEPVTSEMKVAGSLRRMKRQVGDVEIIFIPRIETRPEGLFDTRTVDLAELANHAHGRNSSKLLVRRTADN